MRRVTLKIILALQLLLLIVVGVWYFSKYKKNDPIPLEIAKELPKIDENGFVKLESISELTKLSSDPSFGSKIHSIEVSGILLKGNQIDRAYCSTGIYLKDPTGKIQLRVKSPNDKVDLYSDDSFIGKDVTVKAFYPTGEGTCAALLCACDQYIMVSQLIPR